MNRILILTGGTVDMAIALEVLRGNSFTHRIVVDGALGLLDQLNERMEGIDPGEALFLPDHVVGDFDTVAPAVLDRWRSLLNGKAEFHQFRPEKDYTDTDIAMKLALKLASEPAGTKDPVSGAFSEQVPPEILILGATGTRMDHTLANIGLLLQAYRAGIPAQILDAHNRIRLFDGELRLRRDAQYGRFISLLPLYEALKGVTLTGVKYPLRDGTVRMGESLCVSNEITHNEAVLRVREGIAILIESKD